MFRLVFLFNLHCKSKYLNIFTTIFNFCICNPCHILANTNLVEIFQNVSLFIQTKQTLTLFLSDFKNYSPIGTLSQLLLCDLFISVDAGIQEEARTHQRNEGTVAN